MIFTKFLGSTLLLDGVEWELNDAHNSHVWLKALVTNPEGKIVGSGIRAFEYSELEKGFSTGRMSWHKIVVRP